MDASPALLNRATIRNPLSSPSAAKTEADPRAPRIDRAVAGREMPRDGLHLLRPASLVRPERRFTASGRERVEPRFDHAQQRAAGDGAELERDQGRGFLRVVP